VSLALSCPDRARVRALFTIFLEGPVGFNELGRTVGGCNPATLKLRLDCLVIV
jgi:DNA-binding HxlR family transcriptional regulator